MRICNSRLLLAEDGGGSDITYVSGVEETLDSFGSARWCRGSREVTSKLSYLNSSQFRSAPDITSGAFRQNQSALSTSHRDELTLIHSQWEFVSPHRLCRSREVVWRWYWKWTGTASKKFYSMEETLLIESQQFPRASMPAPDYLPAPAEPIGRHNVLPSSNPVNGRKKSKTMILRKREHRPVPISYNDADWYRSSIHQRMDPFRHDCLWLFLYIFQFAIGVQNFNQLLRST